MTARSAAALAIAFVIGLAGCAGPPGPPWPETVSPNGITLRWYPSDTSEAEAQQVADEHCAPARQGAAIAWIEQDGSVEIGSFRCG